MTWRVTLHPAAEAEMRQAGKMYESARAGLGKRFYSEVRAIRKMIADIPQRYPPWPEDPSFRRALVRMFPFVLFYWIDAPRSSVVIAAVAHTSRKPGYWLR